MLKNNKKLYLEANNRVFYLFLASKHIFWYFTAFATTVHTENTKNYVATNTQPELGGIQNKKMAKMVKIHILGSKKCF